MALDGPKKLIAHAKNIKKGEITALAAMTVVGGVTVAPSASELTGAQAQAQPMFPGVPPVPGSPNSQLLVARLDCRHD